VRKSNASSLWIASFVLVGAFLGSILLFFLSPSIGDRGHEIRVRFSDVNQISVGTRVLFAGKPVGKVERIEIFPSQRQEGQEVDVYGRPYLFLLHCFIDSKTQVYDSDIIDTVTSGLLGETEIVIVPSLPPPGKRAKLANSNTVFFANCPGSLERTVYQIEQISKKTMAVLDKIDNFMAENERSISVICSSLGRLASDVDETQTIALLAETLRNCNQLLETMDKYGILFQYSSDWNQKQEVLQKEEVLHAEE